MGTRKKLSLSLRWASKFAFILVLVVITILVAAQSFTIQGNGRYTNSLMLLCDRKIPEQGSPWASEQTVQWQETGTEFIINLCNVRLLKDMLLQVDCNDTYVVECSMDNQNWVKLFTFLPKYGEIVEGMDTMCSKQGEPDYVPELEFEPVETQYIRVYASGGDGNFAISEIRFSCTYIE